LIVVFIVQRRRFVIILDLIININVGIIDLTDGKLELPSYVNIDDIGMSVYANIKESVTIKAKDSDSISIGIKVFVPIGYIIEIMPIMNEISAYRPRTISSEFNDEVELILVNNSNQDFIVNPGDYIAQIVLSLRPMLVPILKIKWELINV